MKIIGLNHGEIDSSAAVVVGGRVLAASAEGRFNRQKKSKVFPRQALGYCLAMADTKLSDCDLVVQAWNPGAAWEKYNPMISANRTRREDNFYSIPDHLLNFVDREPCDWVAMDFPESSKIPRVVHVMHHRAHAANAFFLSPFEEAAVLTCDWRGEFESASWGEGKGTQLNVFQKQHMPHSLGMFYATFTELLGYKSDNDEWKVMALSAVAGDCEDLLKKVRTTFRLGANGTFELDETCYQGGHVERPRLYSEKMVKLLGGRVGAAAEEPSDWHCAVAKAMQLASEEIATHMLMHLHSVTRSENLAVAGGYFMNSVFNGKILDRTPFKKLFVSYAPGDIGNSIGAALYAAHCLHNEERDFSFHSSYLGPEFSRAEVVAALERRRIKFRVIERMESEIAALLADGNIVAVFNGRMEFGERALGNRSILADPRRSDIKEKVNSQIKYREGYRPFAPSTLYEKVHVYFDVDEGFDCPYMEKVVSVREKFRRELPGITHFDGSGRVQTVKKDVNPRYHSIIAEVERMTGFAVVLNTSFNINGEPIVLSPDDAISTFFNSGLEYLALGNCLVNKQ